MPALHADNRALRVDVFAIVVRSVLYAALAVKQRAVQRWRQNCPQATKVGLHGREMPFGEGEDAVCLISGIGSLRVKATAGEIDPSIARTRLPYKSAPNLPPYAALTGTFFRTAVDPRLKAYPHRRCMAANAISRGQAGRRLPHGWLWAALRCQACETRRTSCHPTLARGAGHRLHDTWGRCPGAARQSVSRARFSRSFLRCFARRS